MRSHLMLIIVASSNSSMMLCGFDVLVHVYACCSNLIHYDNHTLAFGGKEPNREHILNRAMCM